VAAGRITTFGPDKLIDPELADVQWARNTRARIAEPSLPAAVAGLAGVIVANEVGRVDSYEDARRRRESAEASIAEMKQAEMEGKLIQADAVRAAWSTLITSTRDALLQIPSRIAPVLAAETDLVRCTAVLEDALRQALSQLSSNEE